MVNKKSSRHSAHRKGTSSKGSTETKSLRNIKTSPSGNQLKQSLSKLLNTGQSMPDEVSSSKSMSISQDDAWVEV